MVDALVRATADDAIKALVGAFLKASGNDIKAATAIEQVCYRVMPVVYRPDDLQRAKTSIVAGAGAFVSLPVTYAASIELIMAGVDSRPALFPPPTSAKDFPSGQLLLPSPPEGGLDENGEVFLADFLNHLHGKFLPVGSPGPAEAGVERLIETVLREHLEGGEHPYRYYCVLSNPPEPTAVARRQRIAERLQEMIPSVVVICLEKASDTAWELKVLSRLHRLLCKVAGVRWTP
ncbi:hypothetical protein [Gemmata massiliana]|uniref:hypothetical protein n=1 Tax=Gemmata massiliana TaxID=1210884 RepID=UPI0013A6CD9B|nr:hypothetical protein [Gemmata massiliana]